MRLALLILYFIFLVALLLALIFHFRSSVKKTIYAYRNCCYIAGILYVSMMIILAFGNVIFGLIRGEKYSLRALFLGISQLPQEFALFALPVIIAFSLAIFISNIALIRHEGFRITNLLGAVLGGLFFGMTIGANVAAQMIYKYVLTPAGLIDSRGYITFRNSFWMFVMMMICYFQCVLVGFCIMGFVAAKHIPEYDKDFIIILGCSISKEGGLLPLLKGRTNKAIRFAWDQEIATEKPVRYVPSGGKGANEVMSEGSAMELYLLSHGAEYDEVFAEKESKNTFENMKFSKQLIDRINPNAKIAFATTNYHVYRSGILARRAGFDAEGIASSTKWYFWPNGFIREFFGVLSMERRAHGIAAIICAVFCGGLGVLTYIFF